MTPREHKRVEAPPEYWAERRSGELFRKVAQAVRAVLRGQANNSFEVALVVGEAETRIETPLARGAIQFAHVTPLSASAAGFAVWTEVVTGAIVLHHSENLSNDRIFAVTLHG